MDHKITLKRALAFVLALEMFCAPLAIARVQDPEAILATPQGEETFTSYTSPAASADLPAIDDSEASADPVATTPAQAAPLAVENAYYNVYMGYGIPLDPDVTNEIVEFGGYLTYEVEPNTGTWGSRVAAEHKYGVIYKNELYTALPKVGRVPDKELDGFYVVGAQPTGSWQNSSALTTWSFDERWFESDTEREAYKLEEVEGDPVADYGFNNTRWYHDDADVYNNRYATVARIPTTEDVVKSFVRSGTGEIEVPIVARWTASSRDDLTAMDLTLSGKDVSDLTPEIAFTEDPRGVEDPETLDLSEFQKDSPHELWLRVPEELETLSISLKTYEPYYQYNVKGEGECPITAEYTFTAATGKVEASLDVYSGVQDDSGAYVDPIVPAPTLWPGGYEPRNSVNDPAHAQWTIADIPLAKVDTAATNNDGSILDPFTTVTFSITAPDGKTTAEYKLHVERLTTPVSNLAYGNTPYGMISKDTSSRWSDENREEGETPEQTAAKNKQAAKDYFRLNHTFEGMPITPSGSGSLFPGFYYTTAWTTQTGNLDLNDSAVVAYLDMSFADPGVSFVDSEGRAVKFGDTATDHRYTDCVTRTLELLVADGALTPDLYGATEKTNDGVRKVWYVGGEDPSRLSDTEAPQTLRNADGSDVVDLKGLKVLPGVYTMVYTFVDPVNGDVVTATRPLAVLPIPGDVDMDGAVTHADARVLDENRADWDGYSGQVFRLLQYRVYNDQQLKVGNAVGSSAIRNGFQPTYSGGSSNYPYRPLDTTDVYTRKTWSELTAGDAAPATLELRYLGPEEGTRDERGHTNGITGPWAADPTQGVSLVTEKHPDAHDTFWVGVYLDLKEGSGLSGKAIRDLTLSLTYDSEYVEPALVYDFGADASYTTDDARWENITYYSFNMGTHSVDSNHKGMTIFSGKSGSDYHREGTARSRAFVTHYSKVKGSLEQTATTSNLRELVVSLQSRSQSPASLQSGCLLVLPFRLIKHPESRVDAKNMARLIELSAGMRELTLVTPATTTYALPGAASRQVEWMAQLMEASTGVRAVSEQTYAFSAQTSIYGGATANLRELVTCAPTAKGLVLLGEDNTESVRLYNETFDSGTEENAQYDKEFSTSVVMDFSFNDSVQPQGLPPGLKYYPSMGRIIGVPTLASAALAEPDADGNLYKPYTFTIGGVHYSIVVEPRTLHYQVDGRSAYYGESMYRGMNSEDYTFGFNTADLAARDVQAYKAATGKEPTGNGTELDVILAGQNYTAPTFYAYVASTGGAAQVDTPVRAEGLGYPILVNRLPKADNYKFVYETGSTLSIMARPIYIDSILADYAAMEEAEPGVAKRYNAQIYNNDSLTDETFIVDETKGHGELRLVLPHTINGLYKNLLLADGDARVGDDKLRISFMGRFLRSQSDIESGDNYIHMTQRQETRMIGNIRNLTLLNADGTANRNYTLEDRTGTVTPSDNFIQGIVLRCGINSIQITNPPTELRGGTVVAGSPIINTKTLRIRLDLENNIQVGDFAYDIEFEAGAESILVWDLHYNWVSADDMADGMEDETGPTGTGLILNDDGTLSDSHPYGNGVLTTDMDGWYLCVAARKYDAQAGETVEFVKTYSEHPLHISARPITLEPSRANRYYGDENANLTYTYRWRDLSLAEQELVRELMGYGTQNPQGTQEEFETLLAAKGIPQEDWPKLAVMQDPVIPTGDDDPLLVKANTPRGAGNFYVVLYGAQCSDYAFRYTQSGVGGTSTSTSFGYNTFTIFQRPIVVSDLYSAVSETDGPSKRDFATIYADTKNLFLTEQIDGTAKTAFTAASDRVVFKTAGRNERDQLTYFTHLDGANGRDETSQATPTSVDYIDRDLAVLEEDKANLSVSYTVRFIPDRDPADQMDMTHAVWQSFTENYFDVDTLTAVGGEDQRYVEIGDLKLTGSAANNYFLVFDSSEQAEKQAPANAEQYTAPDPAHRNERTGYQRYGTGKVILRPIEAMELTGLGKMNYTYGETWAPIQPNGNHNLTLQVRYATQYDNDLANNVHTESLRYGSAVSADGTLTDNFTQRGFTIYYLDKNANVSTAALAQAAKEQAVDAGQRLENDDRLCRNIHNDASIFVVGKRGADDPPVYSELGDQPIKVRQAELTLIANDMHRFYGEANETAYCASGDAFGFTYDASQLASWDQGTPITDLAGYQAPTITTTATPTSPVNKDQWGEYPVSITAYDFDNYRVTGQPGTLYIYPRPLQVNAISSSAANPVYTIFNATSTNLFTAQYSSDEGRLTLALPNATWGTETYTQPLVNPNAPGGPALGASQSLHLTGSVLSGSDTLLFNASISLADPKKWNLEKDAQDMQLDDMIVTVNAIAGENAKNYKLDSTSSFSKCWGAVKLRTIDHIHIMARPKLEYTYGDTLDLSGLKVRVDYQLGEGESTPSFTVVPYIDATQFQSYGLYVNYWDVSSSGVPAAAPTDSDVRKALTSRYRKADTRDHVTIAATHDTQQYIGHEDPNDPKRQPFSANGKTIIISAYQATSVAGNQPAAEPLILGTRTVLRHNLEVYEYTPSNVVENGVVSGTNSAATIRVSPRRLTFTLSAEDKTYDGSDQAAGTVTLTNVFDSMAQVQVIADNDANTVISEAIKDVVYLPIGASYEAANSKNANDAIFHDLTNSMTGGRLSFQTGSYVANTPGLLSPNERIAWANGYSYGGNLLTFRFVNKNVHYEDDAFDTGRPAVGPNATYDWTRSQTLSEVTSAHDVYNAVTALPVEVTNMRLLGPDAENYTWGSSTARREDTTQVLLTTRAAADNGQAAVPFATIHKANREKLQGRSDLPSLLVDVHTNVVRLAMPQDLAAVNDLADEFASEAHYEYALFYDRDGLFTTWAGDQGDFDHQDTVFFGGETVTPFIDPAYMPDLNRLAKPESAKDNTVYKGQIYNWAKEDGGFALDADAYPGGAEAAPAYWYYFLYTTTRDPLPRDTVFYPLARLSETHNYNPSADLSGDETVTAQSLENAKAAMTALAADPENETLKAEAETASAVVLSAAEDMKNDAKAAAEERKAAELARTESGKWDKDAVTDLPVAASAVKTLTQRLDLLTANRERNTQGEDRTTEYLVELVESIWFTDTQVFEDLKLLDSVVGNNNPTRYYGYYWDVDRSAQVRINKDEWIDLTGDLLVEVRPKDGTGETEVNVNLEDNGGRTATLYVDIDPPNTGSKVRNITIVPAALYVRLGDAPYSLGVVTDPPKPTNRRYTWTTSDPSVATVDENGVVTFRGLGEAVITVTTDNQKSASILVVVSDVLPLPQVTDPLFNYRYSGPWEMLDENDAFRPYEPMTRAQLTVLMDIFLNPEAQWTATAELAYVDVTGKEKYYDAVKRMTAVGVVEGIPGEEFAGDRLVTRAEFATMLCRMLQLEVPDTAGQIHMFEDAGQSETWAYAYIDALARTGVMRGVGGGQFAPNRVLTREESAAVISRLLVTRLTSDQTDLKTPSDMTPANWSYEAVLRAINTIAYPD